MKAPESAVEVERITRSFRGRRVLDIPRLTIGAGEMVGLLGASGSGKSTLLRHIAGLTLADPRSGSVSVAGRQVQTGGRASRDLRRTRAGVGFVFQQFNLVDRLPVMTNVLTGSLARVPLWRSLPRLFTREERAAALAALSRVGIGEHVWQRASTLSGGQQQRAAIARALVQRARLILADEPVASLDQESARRVMEILRALNREDGISVLVSLHQVEVAVRYCDRIVALREGQMVFDGAAAALEPAHLADIYGAEATIPAARNDTITPPRPALTVAWAQA